MFGRGIKAKDRQGIRQPAAAFHLSFFAVSSGISELKQAGKRVRG